MQSHKDLRNAIIACVLAYGPMVALYGACISGRAGWEIPGVELFMLVPIVALLVGLVALPLVFSAVNRTQARSVLVVAAALIVFFVPVMRMSSGLRMFGFRLAAQRAEPLVNAVERYVRDHGAPPEKLQNLVPRYLPNLPSGIPDLEIVTGEDAYGNQWALSAIVGTGFLNWDQFLYLPNQDYSQVGNVERVERWAYVPE
jgi:hypothetical protein